MFQRMLDIGSGSSGGVDVSDTTATEADVLDGKIFHLANGSSAVGTRENLEISDGRIAVFAIQNTVRSDCALYTLTGITTGGTGGTANISNDAFRITMLNNQRYKNDLLCTITAMKNGNYIVDGNLVKAQQEDVLIAKYGDTLSISMCMFIGE